MHINIIIHQVYPAPFKKVIGITMTNVCNAITRTNSRKSVGGCDSMSKHTSSSNKIVIRSSNKEQRKE